MPAGRPLNLEEEFLEGFELCGRATEYLIRAVPDRLWHLPAPAGKGRTIGAIVAHIYSVRRTFAKMGGARVGPSLDRKLIAQVHVQKALHHINGALTDLFRGALDDGRTRVKGMPRRAINMMWYLVQHDAHHRGQIATRARELGHTFASQDMARIWGWSKLP